MTARILIVLCLAFTVPVVCAVDLEKLPPMNEKRNYPPDVEVKGRELEAMEVALRQFRENHFSTSGDLRNFTVQLIREPGKLFVTFCPKIDEPSHRITPARNKYGMWITYAVSLRTLKIIGYHYERD